MSCWFVVLYIFLQVFDQSYQKYSLHSKTQAPTEHYGALTVLTILVVLLCHHNEDGLGWPKVTIFIDNEEIVNRGNTQTPKFCNVEQYLAHDYDLWMTTSALLQALHLAVEFEWVRGHQDVNEQNQNLTATLLNNVVY
jgi:hypothetical protein